MHEHISTYDTVLTTANLAFNIIIVAGYATIPFTALPRLIPWHSPCPKDRLFYRSVRLFWVVFFLTCAYHHLRSAFDSAHADLDIVLNEGVQAGAVWAAIIGFERLVRLAEKRWTYKATIAAGTPDGDK